MTTIIAVVLTMIGLFLLGTSIGYFTTKRSVKSAGYLIVVKDEEDTYCFLETTIDPSKLKNNDTAVFTVHTKH